MYVMYPLIFIYVLRIFRHNDVQAGLYRIALLLLCRLSQYGSRCEWLRDDKFLRDLEGDSVDTEILDEELRSLQDDDTQS